MGDHGSAASENQESCACCHRQLYEQRESLVHALFLLDEPGAEIPDRWWRSHSRVWIHNPLLFTGEVVVHEEEQAAGSEGERDW